MSQALASDNTSIRSHNGWYLSGMEEVSSPEAMKKLDLVL